jgi:hypothetical protein
MDLCKYRDIFGKPNEGVHKHRIFGLAVVDLGMTIILGILIARWKRWNILLVFTVLMILGLIMHKIFCVKTKLTMMIF